MCLTKLENMSEFNFKSSPCTSIEQGERLLALGLKPETADMHWFYTGKIHGWQCSVQCYQDAIAEPFRKEDATNGNILPAWSLHRLIEMLALCPYEIYPKDNVFEDIIYDIEEAIKEGYFNKEYFV